MSECPKCGAESAGTTSAPPRGTLQPRSRTVFHCGSTRYDDDGAFFESGHCLRRQLQQVTEELDEAFELLKERAWADPSPQDGVESAGRVQRFLLDHGVQLEPPHIDDPSGMEECMDA